MIHSGNSYYFAAHLLAGGSRAGMASMPEQNIQQMTTRQVADKAEMARLARERARRWKEEQSLLIDSSRYIQPIEIEEIPRPSPLDASLELPATPFRQSSSDWLTGVVLLILLLGAAARNAFGTYLSALFMSTVNYPAASRLFREQNISLRQGALILEIFFLLTMGLFAFQIVKYSGARLPVSGFLLYLACFAAVLLFFRLKEFLYRFLGFINETLPETGEYLFTMRNYNKVTGILLLPVVCLTAWAPVSNPSVFLLAGLVIIALLYLKTLQRGIKILLKKQFSVFYLFLYLCTLEFLPLLLFLKAI